MSTIICPGCSRTLILPSDCTAAVLSCPRCLTQINNPHVEGASTAVQAQAPPVRETSVTPSPAAPVSRPRIADIDVDVRRDNRRTGCLMTALAVIGGAGIAYALLGSVSLLVAGEFRLLLYVLCVLTVLILLGAGWTATHNPSATPGANVGRTILGVLTVTGAIIVVGGLLWVAGMILLLVVCLSRGGKC